MSKITLLFVCLFFSLGFTKAKAQGSPEKKPGVDTEVLKSANDPLAKTKSLNVHNYFVSSLHGMPEQKANQAMIRYAQPIGKVLFRATLPMQTLSPSNASPESGLGDLNLIALYTIGTNGIKFGAGPLLNIPTGTNHFSTDKWQTGVAAMSFFSRNPTVQLGTLLQWQTDFAGKSNAQDINLLTSQLFAFWQLGGGVYLRSTGVWSFDLRNGDYNIPLGLGIGKVLKVNKLVFNLFTEPQYSVLARGKGQSQLQIFMGINTQF